jgi:hypothetical protein
MLQDELLISFHPDSDSEGKLLLVFKLTKLIIIKQIKIYIKWKCILKIRTLIRK